MERGPGTFTERANAESQAQDIHQEWEWLTDSGAISTLRSIYHTANWKSKQKCDYGVIIESSQRLLLREFLQKSPSLFTARIIAPKRESYPTVSVQIAYNQFEIIPFESTKFTDYRIRNASRRKEQDILSVTAFPEREIEVAHERHSFNQNGFLKRYKTEPLKLSEESWRDENYVERILKELYNAHPAKK